MHRSGQSFDPEAGAVSDRAALSSRGTGDHGLWRIQLTGRPGVISIGEAKRGDDRQVSQVSEHFTLKRIRGILFVFFDLPLFVSLTKRVRQYCRQILSKMTLALFFVTLRSPFRN